MHSVRIRGLVPGLLLVLAASGTGIAIHASEPCQRFMKTYITVPVRNRVSKATAAAWAKWRVGHPNWKPNPAVHRPLYRMSQKEILKAVAFACEATPAPTSTDGFFTPVGLMDVTPRIVMPPLEMPPLSSLPPLETTEVIYPGVIPPETLEVPPLPPTDTDTPGTGTFFPPFVIPPIFGGGVGSGGGGTVVPPVTPPVVPPVTPPILPTPEPASWVLTGLGVLPMLLWVRRVKARA